MGLAGILAEHLHGQANWRADVAERYPDDDRNQHAADALAAAAEAVEGLPDDDPRLRRMYDANWFDDGVFRPWEPAQDIVRRYGFHRGAASVDRLLDDLAESAESTVLDI